MRARRPYPGLPASCMGYPMNAVRQHQAIAGAVIFLLLGATLWSDAAAAAPESGLATIEPNDNVRAAGRLEGGTLTLALRAGVGRWQPEGPSGPTLEIEAFGEIGKALTVPAPLIRVKEGTEIAVSIRNRPRDAAHRSGFLHARRHDVPPARGRSGPNARSAIHKRSSRDVSLLGIDARRARTLS